MRRPCGISPRSLGIRAGLRRLRRARPPEAFRQCSQDTEEGLGPPPIVSAWASQGGSALGRVATQEQSNAITALPVPLRQIALADALIALDAMGCQEGVARDIVEGGGDCVIAVKGNRPSLRAAVAGYFRGHLERGRGGLRDRHFQASASGHGRLDERPYDRTRVPPGFAVKGGWPWVQAVGYGVRRSQQADGRGTYAVRYYSLSRYRSGKRFSAAVRGQWGIESMPWVLGGTWRADDSRTRERAPGNDLSGLGRCAVSLRKRHPVKDSLRGKRLRCMRNTDSLTEVLTLQ